jgi:uncharacterized membrane protein YcaP (DUF421 family)
MPAVATWVLREQAKNNSQHSRNSSLYTSHVWLVFYTLAMPVDYLQHGTMWKLTEPWWELVVRCVIVYFFMLFLLRVSGKRQIGQLAPFDLVLLLVLSNAVQNAMNAGDNSLLAGIILATTLIVLNYLVGLATYKSKRIEELLEGRPEILIHSGKLYESVMKSQQITHHELNAALRAAGCTCIEEVQYAVLENNGNITVQSKPSR